MAPLKMLGLVGPSHFPCSVKFWEIFLSCCSYGRLFANMVRYDRILAWFGLEGTLKKM